MEMNFEVFGHNVIILPKGFQRVNMTEERANKFIETLQKYKKGKENLETNIVNNEKWFKSQHWEFFRSNQKYDINNPEPVSAFLFNTIANKHADMMDNFPEPNILERGKDDKEEAERLTKIIPLVLDKNDFRITYDDAAWYKLKNGCSVYGIFWNPQFENGLGDIDIKKLDLLNLFWKPGITNIQDSPVFFIVSLLDNDFIAERWPFAKDKLVGSKIIDIKQYSHDDTIDTSEMSVVVDAYYKRTLPDGRTILNMTKFLDTMPLESSEDNEDTREKGLYEHGFYPVVFDPLFPENDSPIGFGFIDVIKNPQMYIDKLDQILMKNALAAGKLRIIVKKSSGLKASDIADFSKEIIEYEGNGRPDDAYSTFQAKVLDATIPAHRQNKIDELKEVSGTNDFNRGEAGKGVTAASAIMALQEAGNKISRDIIGRTYHAYSKIVYFCIELIREKYDQVRSFRIEGSDGSVDYIDYKNDKLKNAPLKQMYSGENQKFRRPIFDIKVKPERTNPFSKAAHNELAKELFAAGFFNPQLAPQAIIALEMMSFEGKDKIIQMIRENGGLQEQLTAAQQETSAMKDTMIKMSEIIRRTTGNDPLAGTDFGGAA